MSEDNVREKNIPPKKKNRVANNTYAIQKLFPQKRIEGHNILYISRKTNFKAQLDKCCKLLQSENEIILNAIGAAIQRCCNLALQVKKNYNGIVDFEINTSTTELTDELIPLAEDVKYGSQVRLNSSIHIRLFRKVLLTNN